MTAPTQSEIDAAQEVLDAAAAAAEAARRQAAQAVLQPVVTAGLLDLKPLVAALNQTAISAGAMSMDLTTLFINLAKVLDTAIDKVGREWPDEEDAA